VRPGVSHHFPKILRGTTGPYPVAHPHLHPTSAEYTEKCGWKCGHLCGCPPAPHQRRVHGEVSEVCADVDHEAAAAVRPHAVLVEGLVEDLRAVGSFSRILQPFTDCSSGCGMAVSGCEQPKRKSLPARAHAA
jgi:hypothetical protein